MPLAVLAVKAGAGLPTSLANDEVMAITPTMAAVINGFMFCVVGFKNTDKAVRNPIHISENKNFLQFFQKNDLGSIGVWKFGIWGLETAR